MNPLEGDSLGTNQNQGRELPMGDMASGHADQTPPPGNFSFLVDQAPLSETIETGAIAAPLTSDPSGSDVEMEGTKHPSRPVDVQGLDFGYGKFSPRTNRTDVQSIIWDPDNGHYCLSEITNYSDLNVQPEPHTVVTGGMGRGLGLRMHGITMHGDTLLFLIGCNNGRAGLFLAIYSKATPFMEHVNKEKPFESKFFEPPEPGDAELQEEEMKEIETETPCVEMDGKNPRLSSGLTRLIEEQGVNRYMLRSSDEAGNSGTRHHASKPKLLKPDKNRRKKQSGFVDKENYPINMTINHVGDIISSHVRGDAVKDDQAGDVDIMHNSLHGDKSGRLLHLSALYAGDEGLVAGEEQEVSSDQSSKPRNCTPMEGIKVSYCNLKDTPNLVNVLPGIKFAREQETQGPISIIYPEGWEDIGREGDGVEEWGIIVNRNNVCLEKLGRVEKRKTQDHVIPSQPLDEMENVGDDVNVGCSGRVKKKKNTMRRIETQGHLSQSQVDKRESINSKDSQFQQDFIPRMLTQDPILIKEFNLGTDKGKEAQGNTRNKRRISINPAILKIKEKEARLMEIAKRINTTSANSKLLSSIMGLARSRVTRFSARTNEKGHVTIDESLVTNNIDGNDHNPDPSSQNKPSYANKVTGRDNTTGNDIIKFYSPTLSEDGNPVAVIDPRFIIQAKQEYKNVLYGEENQDNLENSGGTTLANPTIEHLKPQEMHDGQNIYKPSGNGGNTSVKGSPRKGLQNVTITETSNRFVLLNEEGHELESVMGTGTTDDREDINLVELNTGWARNYVGEEELDVDGSIAAVHSRNGEEVESESDATASFMKEDNFNRYSAYSDGKTNEEGVEQVRMDLDMAQAEIVGSEINGS
ncbi:hypothetical protein L1987_16556 [Smallanthus sonchifolius]|uniref:Uncharacterized protein n=1 Tax=Smallanthus sonchifolius TaxID=185202 RepID=A0ACB9JAT1_9ASTR|nr:hypothetical protein L1987_16556 [Smallanthus sonchifolius]